MFVTQLREKKNTIVSLIFKKSELCQEWELLLHYFHFRRHTMNEPHTNNHSMCNQNQILKTLPLKKRRAYLIDSSITNDEQNEHDCKTNNPYVQKTSRTFYLIYLCLDLFLNMIYFQNMFPYHHLLRRTSSLYANRILTFQRVLYLTNRRIINIHWLMSIFYINSENVLVKVWC